MEGLNQESIREGRRLNPAGRVWRTEQLLGNVCLAGFLGTSVFFAKALVREEDLVLNALSGFVVGVVLAGLFIALVPTKRNRM